MRKFVIGVDFGTKSGRSLLVDVETGEEVATSVKEYTHGVMNDYLHDGQKLEPDWSLQHPQDYIDVLASTIPSVFKQSGIGADHVIGVGIDFTSCTMLPIDKDGTPLCLLDEFKSDPHSYVKLWKHHSSQDEANRLNKIAAERGEDFLKKYGGKISAEWLIPKIWQVLNESPEIYERADKFIEAADWVVWLLTGQEQRNSCSAGYKAMWNNRKGYPSGEFFKALDPRLENLVNEKLGGDIVPSGARAGKVTPEASRLTGLKEGTAVAVANIDAHVTVPAAGITEAGKMLMIMGTSTCHIVMSQEEKDVPGICGAVEHGVLPGYIGYEAGQSCVGDLFEWFIENCLPACYEREAMDRGIGMHELLIEKSGRLKAGESGLIALDWWNGNRSVLADADLTGVILGMTMQTKPEHIYRALIEATAFGTRTIIGTFIENGVEVNELFATGGIASKNKMMMQIYSDITNREIRIVASRQAPALGSAMFGAVAAGLENGGYSDIFAAARAMSQPQDEVFKPDPENAAAYDKLYAEYKRLHDYFGLGGNPVMNNLKQISQTRRQPHGS